MRALPFFFLLFAALGFVSGPATAATFTQITFDSGYDPQWSRDGSNRIVYTRGYHIMIVPSSGGAPVEVTYDLAGSIAWFPTWSPGGSSVAFESPGGTVICPGVEAGDTLRTGLGGNTNYLSWSPLGDQLAFTVNSRVFVCPATPGGYAARVPIEGIGNQSTAPSWSPDGSKIAFVNNTSSGTLFTVPADGSAAPTGLYSHPDNRYTVRDPDWSPDGSWILYAIRFHQPGLNERYTLWTIPASGGDPVQIKASSEDLAREPCWSPDGTAIAFAGPGGIWVMTDLSLPTLGADLAPPTQPMLMTARPNPFRGHTLIRVSGVNGNLDALVVYDSVGHFVRRLAIAGVDMDHGIAWDGRDSVGRRLAEGVYFLEASRRGVALARGRVVLLR